MVDFKSLKKNSGQKSLAELTESLNKLVAKEDNAPDERYWKLTVDKAGNGSAVIRFLPAPGNEDSAFIRYWDHGFSGPGGWYIEKSLTTLGQVDPVAENNKILWDSGEAGKKLVSGVPKARGVDGVPGYKRRLHYVSGIYVIDDSGNPENNGKVFLFEYGSKILEKLQEAEEEGFSPFDFWSGANFHLKAQNKDGYRNYDKSKFLPVGPLLDDDSAMEKIWKSQFSLKAEIAPEKFKSYIVLKAQLDKVLGNRTGPSAPIAEVAAPQFKTAESVPFAVEEDSEEHSENFFRNLAS